MDDRDPPSEIVLIPAGPFRAREGDGRPKDAPHWYLTPDRARAIASRWAQASGDMPLDYEHQTLKAEHNGQPAPASGWCKKLDWRDGVGLVALDVRWTDRAAEHIRAGEYRYISPVFGYRVGTGEILDVQMASLTNYPAIDGHSDLAARAAATFQTAEETVDELRERLIYLLNLPLTTTDADLTAELEKAISLLRGAEAAQTEAATALGLPADAPWTSVTAAIKGIGSSDPDPSKYVPLSAFEALKGEVVALKAERNAAQVDDLIASGLEQGKLLPVQEQWARDLGVKDVAALRGYLDKTPAISALSGTQTGGKPPELSEPNQLSETEMAVCKATGVSTEAFRAAKGAA
ncbi:MAG: hypothetical protein AUJ55_06655 [Proteobacteria bacterium CG1_02_64_396]|nr:MAG: hypothetical protein AUJ55_06655 [Proteobacteria bacterium CG1_02_64_396]